MSFLTLLARKVSLILVKSSSLNFIPCFHLRVLELITEISLHVKACKIESIKGDLIHGADPHNVYNIKDADCTN